MRNALSSLRVICAMTNHKGAARNHHHKLTLIAIEEHWMMPELTAALGAVAHPDESLAFNTIGEITFPSVTYTNGQPAGWSFTAAGPSRAMARNHRK